MKFSKNIIFGVDNTPKLSNNDTAGTITEHYEIEGGEILIRIDTRRLEIELARRCMSSRDLRKFVSQATVKKMQMGETVTLKSIGKIAAALGVDVEQLIAKEG